MSPGGEGLNVKVMPIPVFVSGMHKIDCISLDTTVSDLFAVWIKYRIVTVHENLNPSKDFFGFCSS